MPTTIVLADDHPIVRQGLRALLDAEPAFRIVGEATDGPETIALVERLQPTILILDVLMPGLSGMEITRRVANISPPRASSSFLSTPTRHTSWRHSKMERRAML